MKHSFLIIATGLLAVNIQASAQNTVRIPDPFDNLPPAKEAKLKEQATSIFLAAKPAVATASKSTVSISYSDQRIAYGTVVSPPGTTQPAILTKWSEVIKARSQLVVTTPDGTQHSAQVYGIYPNHDLALLTIKTPDAKLVPLDLNASAIPEPGNFITLARPDGNIEGFGVVSVKARSLREGDKAYLGVHMDFTTGNKGVPIKQVMAKSAASRAGLRDGDVIVSLNQKNISGPMEMRNILQRLTPGSDITVRYRRGNAEKDTTVNLGSRSDITDILRIPRKRMEQMGRMGTVPSRIRTNFPNVIQSDMPIQVDPTPHDPQDNSSSSDCGGPVTDLDGNIVGIAIARGGRIKTFIIPTSTIQKVLSTTPQPVNNRKNTRGNTPNNIRHTANNSPPPKSPLTSPNNHNHVPPRAIPAEEDDIGKARKLLGEMEQNNNENTQNLQKIKDALRKLNEQGGNQR